MTDETMPDWVILEAAKRSEWHGAEFEIGFCKNQYRVAPGYRALCDMIAKHEQPPVDRKLACAREAMAREAEATTTAKWAAKFREGSYDETDHITVPIRAIELWEEGFGK